MPQNLTAYMVLGAFLLWFVLALQAGNVPTSLWLWFKNPHNAARSLRWGVWLAALLFAGITWIARPGTALADFRTEATGIAIAVVIIEEISRWRAYLENKQFIIRQLMSRSNDFALDAARQARDEGWLTDGTLRGIDLTKASLWRADLSNVDLQGANLTKTNFHRVDLTGARLAGAIIVGTNLRGAKLSDTDLTGAQISRIEFDSYTVWPEGFVLPDDAIDIDTVAQ